MAKDNKKIFDFRDYIYAPDQFGNLSYTSRREARPTGGLQRDVKRKRV